MGKGSKKSFWNRQKKQYRSPFSKHSSNYDEQFAKKKEHDCMVKDSLREDQVHITEYVNKGEGFQGILKSRYSDFHVNEIDLAGEILQLNDLSIPEEIRDDLSVEEINSAKEELKHVITEDLWNKMKQLSENKLENRQKPKDSAIFLDVTELNKEQRTQVHRVIKKVYDNKLVSSTYKDTVDCSEDDTKRIIRVMKYSGRDRNRWSFPKQVVHFLVHKENLDTTEIASIIAQKLNLKPSQVNYSGIKDKRAKTTQKFSIKKRPPRQIVGTVKHLNGVTIGNFKFKDKMLKLGDLRGNRFRIAIRNLTGERQHIETSLNNMKEKGFINYFGLQRFGNCSSIPTYDVGVALLKADYKLACELILKPRDNDIPFLKEVREMWWKNRDSKAAAAQLRSDRLIEKKLLNGLAQFGEKDYSAALRKIPRNMLLLYPHAFQSLIFNKVASKRIKEFGLSVIPGDLVYRTTKDELDEDIEAMITDQEDEDEEETENASYSAENETLSKENEKLSMANTENIKIKYKRSVKALNEEDIASGTYTIYDIVLPLPGHDITYPENVVGSWYKDFLEEYQLSSEMLKHKVKLFEMKGTYRKLLEKPRDMSWEITSYSSPEETLILSDLEILQGKKLENLKKDGTSSKYEALLLDFCLPPSCYATMMLRELLKCDTSSSAQIILQKAAIKEHMSIKENDKDTEDVEASAEKRKADDHEAETESVKPAKLLKDNDSAN